MISLLRRVAHDNSGGTSIEYGLIAAAIGVAISSTVFAISGSLNATFGMVLADLTTTAR